MNQSVVNKLSPVEASKRSKLDQLYNEYPCQTLPFGILEDKWEHFTVNNDTREIIADRLNDPFISFLSEHLGGFEGKRILELGPLEGFHTHKFCKMGVEDVLGIEGNPRNFLKCLIVKNFYQLKAARFLLGDFTKYLEQEDAHYSYIHATGVLYHLARPLALLDQITKKTTACGICTTLYDPNNLTFPLSGRTRQVTHKGTEPFVLHERLNDVGMTKNKKHGMEESAWLISREDLLRYLDFRGFDCIIFNSKMPKTGATRMRLLAKKKD